jgi:protein arginine kinase
MIDLSLLPDGGMAWLDASGPGSHLVLSTRIRLARNLASYTFATRNNLADREAILRDVLQAARDTVSLRNALNFRLDHLEPVDRQLLHERHLISKELAAIGEPATVRSGAALLVQDRVNDFLSHFTPNLVTLPPVPPMSALDCGRRCLSICPAWC